FCRDIIGRKVLDSSGAPLGEISDLLIDLTHERPTLAILSVRKSSEESGTFGLALSGLKAGHGGLLRTDADQASFAEAPLLNDDSWQPLENGRAAVIYRLRANGIGTPHSRASKTPGDNQFSSFA